MDIMDIYHPPYSTMAIQPYSGPPNASLAHGHQHYPKYWPQQPFLALYQQQQQQRAVLMMNHGNVLPPKQAEPKPRLAKDEVELLEQEFLKNPKPASTLKRELAEQMAVDVSRINVRAPIKRLAVLALVY
jgi:hypothetical protein